MWIAPLPVGGPRMVLAVVRYREGTLSYNEVFVGSVVRRGFRVGLWVHGIWVDSVESLWGGREIWGLPKELATFTWRNRGLTMTAQDGRLDVRFSGSPRWSARVPFVAPAFGLGSRFFYGIGHGRLRLARLEVSADLPCLRTSAEVPALWLNDFHLVVRAPTSFVESES
ncbi:acetoacetate decarboxylase family protein [Kutzneria chonburiensis]|uniref:Acetoacetate decarboxylase family protein n=1 Tax=Kutzneria chonburiensis TaxID=1483604 RepID=A0ABV6MQ98_9PSEU|nr:acetoacetate decarboxylase family protein [Kutzneria chonburiensis]